MSVRSSGEGGLVWAIGASGLAHGAALAFLALAPSRFDRVGMPLESYSVELVSPSAVGGTHLPGPPVGRPDVLSRPAPPVPREPSVPTAKELPPVPKAVEPEVKPAPPEEPPKAEEVSKEEAPPAKKEEVAKIPEVEKVEVPAVSLATKAKKKRSSPPPKKEAARKANQGKREEKAAKKDTEAAAQKPKKELTDLDKQIAAAIQRRADAAKADSDKSDIDRKIAEAVQRRTMDAARSTSGIGGSGATVAGVGPGSGVGGAVRGIEYVMYRAQMESRIKAAWVWAGADRSLRAVVRFNVTAEGKIINVKTVEPSGDASYDASVERAIRAAGPLGPPPEAYREEFGTVELEFRAEDARG